MGTAVRATSFAPFFVLLCGCTPNRVALRSREVEMIRFTKYTLAQCIAKGYPDTPVAADAREALGGYLENGNLEMDAYAESTALAQLTLQEQYRGLHGEPLHVAKCLDMLGSEALDTLVFRWVK
jgi:hypothetical protein